jgi:hypothetical protein
VGPLTGLGAMRIEHFEIHISESKYALHIEVEWLISFSLKVGNALNIAF